eukprot:TRINITY_DN7185_c0_g1_i1.p1 TRINITY_DN7185_c0_g1~~TRINITY_DN7185_c0_g1_i1.p1  ORF type:complete len:167 (-),score=7.67 TRINITY_DN7185_c0_g1_i1:55-555(-)
MSSEPGDQDVHGRSSPGVEGRRSRQTVATTLSQGPRPRASRGHGSLLIHETPPNAVLPEVAILVDTRPPPASRSSFQFEFGRDGLAFASEPRIDFAVEDFFFNLDIMLRSAAIPPVHAQQHVESFEAQALRTWRVGLLMLPRRGWSRQSPPLMCAVLRDTVERCVC